MDSSEVGRFGTLCLVKRLEPHKVVASYPVDDEEVTMGRDPSCSIRLYYESVSALHCKIIFRERKAFLVVLGTNGVIVDACPVFPSAGPGGSPVTVPLPNDSMIEINKKCFVFSYPPKELRAALIDTPTRPDIITPDMKRRRRTLRMSMIHSAQVFTPRPSNDPRENLRILKTPIKTPFIRPNRRQSSPLKRGMFIPEEEEEEDEEEDIVLVETNHPQVVEEDRDLVILEHVTVEVPEPQPVQQRSPEKAQRLVQFPIPQAGQGQMQTPPRRRPQSRTSLHKAVLLRSAHRSALRAEMEREEEQDAEEVEETIQALDAMEDLREENDEDDEIEVKDEPAEEVGAELVDVKTGGAFSGLRKSLGLVTGWLGHTSASRVAREDHYDHEEEPEDDEDDLQAEAPTHELEEEEEEDAMHIEEGHPEEPEPVAPLPQRSPVRARPPARFMTPQAQRVGDFGLGKNRARNPARYSVGGFTPGGIHGAPVVPVLTGSMAASGPRRVRLVEPWKVEDIMVPLADGEEEQEQEQEQEHEEEQYEEDDVDELPMRPRSVTLSPSKKAQISEAERQAIINRRRSALTAPDTFFGGEMPGSRRLSLFAPASPMRSPAKTMHAPATPAAEHASSTSEGGVPERDEYSSEEDPQIMLARMKHMVEDVKRRRSMGIRPSPATGATSTPKTSGFSLLAPDADSNHTKQIDVAVRRDEDDEDRSDKENDTEPVTTDSERDDKEDVEMEAQDAGAEEAPVHADHNEQEPQTPPLDGLRHMLAVPRDAGTPSFGGVREMLAEPTQIATPRMDGLSQLFRQERAPATPAFEGIGEMLEPPSEWEAAPAEPEQQPEQQPIEKAQPRPAAKPAVTANPAVVARRTTPRGAPFKPTSKSSLLAVNEDRPSTSTVPPPAARVVRRPVRGRPAGSETEQEVGGAFRPVRRTRKASESPAPEPVPSATKSPRKPRGTKAPTPTPEGPPSKPSATRRKAKSPIPEAEEEEPAARPQSPEIDETSISPSKVRRSARGKSTTQEEGHAPEPAVTQRAKTAPTRLFAPRALRGRRPAGVTPSSIPTSGARSAKPPSTTRRAAPASAKGGADAPPVTGNKENTPERQDAEEEQAQASGKPSVKAKAARSASKARAPAEDVGEKEPADARSRVSRLRTRTGK